jgi:DNA-binding IclR family transcriptional regulator
MDEGQLEESILLALRNSPGSRPEELAEAVGLPRTNFGRRLKHSLREPLERLLAEGSVEEDRGRYRLTEKGRRRLAARANGF